MTNRKRPLGPVGPDLGAMAARIQRNYQPGDPRTGNAGGDHEYTEAQSKGTEGWTEPKANDETEGGDGPLKIARYSVETLQVEVPATISAESFDPALEDYCSSRKGYDGLEEGGIVIDAADLPGIIESEAEDEQIAAFFKEVDRVRGSADRLYFHRAS